MAWLFYLLSALLLLWALLAMALVVYSLWTTIQRTRRAELRVRMREVFQAVVTEAGGSEFVRSDQLADALRRAAGKDRECMRDALVEYAQRTNGELLKPLSEAYEGLGFIEQDVRSIQQGNWHQKADAAMRLGRMRCRSATEVLTGALRDSNEEVRLAAVCALAEIGDPHSISAIVHSLSGANGWQVLQVADKLLHMRVDLTHILLELLQSSGAVRTRREAVTKTVLELIADFGQRGCERLNVRTARAAAIQYLNNDSIDMRARALRALAAVDIESNEELEMVLSKLSDKDWEVRAVAAKVLGLLGKGQAIPALTQALTDEAWWVRHNAANALAMLGKYGIQALRAQTTNPDRFARDIAKQVIEELDLDAAVKTEHR